MPLIKNKKGVYVTDSKALKAMREQKEQAKTVLVNELTRVGSLPATNATPTPTQAPASAPNPSPSEPAGLTVVSPDRILAAIHTAYD